MHRSKNFTALLALILCLLVAAPAMAQGNLKPKVDNFILFQDYSGSMAMHYMDKGAQKIVMSKEILTAMNAKIPLLKYNGALYTFAPYGDLAKLAPYDRAAIGAGIAKIKTDFEIFGRQTPMGDGMGALSPVIGATSGKIAVILLTDGESNLGTDPVAEAKALYAKHGNRLCLHVISFADTSHGKRIIDAIRSVSPCTVFVEASALKDPKVMDKFIEDVFVEKGKQAAGEVLVFRNLNFGFDKFDITNEMLPSLEQALTVLQQRPDLDIVCEGHTDGIGSEAYNQALSERRAKSVVDWLVKHGIDSQRIEAVGYGKMKPKYDNATAEGRALNRRVEIRSK